MAQTSKQHLMQMSRMWTASDLAWLYLSDNTSVMNVTQLVRPQSLPSLGFSFMQVLPCLTDQGDAGGTSPRQAKCMAKRCKCNIEYLFAFDNYKMKLQSKSIAVSVANLLGIFVEGPQEASLGQIAGSRVKFPYCRHCNVHSIMAW